MSELRPLIGLTLGDPAGIGPEIVAAAIENEGLSARARLVVLGPAALRPAQLGQITRAELGPDVDRAWLDTGGDPREWRVGEAGPAAARAALSALRAAHELSLEGAFQAMVTAPVSKYALHLAGERVEGQTQLLARWCGARRYEMMAIAGALRVMLLTRHMPLRQALEAIHADSVVDRLQLFDEGLRGLGFERPKLALAGLNPHAGEHGLLGSEEETLLEPALERARGLGLDVTGPLSPDTVFLQASQGRFDGVLALYHDQAFIPIKLLSAERGVTVVAGLPYLRVSPVHGTAFDIAGKGSASPENLIFAVDQAARWCALRKEGDLDERHRSTPS